MSGLWELARWQRRTGVLTPGETVPQVFVAAVRARGDRVWLREKKLGLWREDRGNA